MEHYAAIKRKETLIMLWRDYAERRRPDKKTTSIIPSTQKYRLDKCEPSRYVAARGCRAEGMGSD